MVLPGITTALPVIKKTKKKEEKYPPVKTDFTPSPIAEAPKEVPKKEFYPSEEGTGGGSKLLPSATGNEVFLIPMKAGEVEREGLAGVKGGLSAEQQAAEDLILKRNRQIAAQNVLGNIGNITAEQRAAAAQENELTGAGAIIPEVLSSIGSKAAIGAAGGAAAGALAGGVGALPGAAAGGVGGAIVGAGTILSSLKSEAIQNTKVQKISVSTSRTNIKAIIEGVHNGLIDPIDAIQLYNREIAKIDRAERNLKKLGERDWLSKSKDELINVQSFNDFERQRSALALEQAIINPKKGITFDLSASLGEGDIEE